MAKWSPVCIHWCERMVRFARASISRTRCRPHRCRPEYDWKKMASFLHLSHRMQFSSGTVEEGKMLNLVPARVTGVFKDVIL